ncbi:hypothetical protein [Actinomadura sp. NPDC048394]|jgi:hypothetical protein|uniref:hypothetical protein n=1 Tax=Actinomadura sp. NPDC048394 TaxID=3158223 RepID=UPI00340DDEFB
MNAGRAWEAASTPPRLSQIVILIGAPEEVRRTGAKVTAPARLLRAWRLLTMLDREMHAGPYNDETCRRVGRLFNRVRGEVLASVSAPLAEEVRHLIPALDEHPRAVDTRLACSGARGWLDSLVTSMLLQLGSQAAGAPAAPRHAPSMPRRDASG